MSTSADIDKLIARVVLKDRDAFRLLYDLTSAKLFGICLRILKDRADAEDVLQEVYVKIWNKADRFSTGQASAIAWLASIARNQAIDRYRSRRPASDNTDEIPDIADDAPSPENAMLAKDETHRINNCLDELDAKHAAAIRRTYLSGWSYQEAADELQAPLNTVRTWIRRGLLSLRDCMNR
ncbi:sigma-70 family RNA polymerase sigma factor [Anderseniella sp. Alg231-50]|uniref:sigma-70 family RNA polymerase sigma factor n=1 Tax=Anderseniella sp. Alg231-50 TaxID=1922226 RepID=UPI000D555EC9